MMKKSKGKYWYKDGDTHRPFDKCSCGRFKDKNANLCSKCSGRKPDGTWKKKLWKDRRTKVNEYIYVYNPKHPHAHANGYMGEHIIILEKKLGRKLKHDEVVHHINEIRNDNREENLMLMTKDEHNKFHNPKTGRDKMYYGKHLSHKLDYCKCGNTKDTRSKNCRTCYYKLRR